MRKLLFIAVLSLFSFGTVHSQTSMTGLRLGVNAGLPMGDVDDISSFRAGADLAYMISLMDIVQVGAMVGYSHYFGEMELTISSICLSQLPAGLVFPVPLWEVLTLDMLWGLVTDLTADFIGVLQLDIDSLMLRSCFLMRG